MRVSLIIPTYNREYELIACLSSAFAQDFPDYEILLIDQTPYHSPAMHEFLSNHASKLRVLRPAFASLTKARNLGLREASGEIVVFIDDDTTFGSSFLSEHVAALSAGHDIVQGRILEKGSRTYSSPLWLSRFGTFSGGDTCLTDGPCNVVTGANFSFRREILNKLKGFDENFQGIATHEDSDFGYRAYLAGYRGWFSARAELFHHKALGGVGNRGRFIHLEYGLHRSKMYFYYKNFAWWAATYQAFRLMSKGLRHSLRMSLQARRDARTLLATSPGPSDT